VDSDVDAEVKERVEGVFSVLLIDVRTRSNFDSEKLNELTDIMLSGSDEYKLGIFNGIYELITSDEIVPKNESGKKMINFLKSELLEGGELKELIEIQIDRDGVDEILNQYLPYYLAGMLFDEMPPFKKAQKQLPATSMTKKRQHSEIAENQDDDDDTTVAYSSTKGSVKKMADKINKNTKTREIKKVQTTPKKTASFTETQNSIRDRMNELSAYIYENDPSNRVNNALRYKNQTKNQGITANSVGKRNLEKLENIYSQFDPTFQGYGLHSKGKRTFSGRGMTQEPVLSTKYNSKNGKIYLDLKNLKKNILSVKYHSSNKYKISPTHVSDNVRIVIMEIVLKNTVNPDVFEAVGKSDVRLVENFIVVFDKEADVEGFDQ
jgi:hypothetical protein